MRASADCRKSPRRAREGRSPLEFQSYPAACTPEAGDFCGGKSHFPEQKSIPCSFCARKSVRISAKEVVFANSLAKTSRFATEWLRMSHSPLERVAVAGELASPSTSLSKYYFDKLRRLLWMRASVNLFWGHSTPRTSPFFVASKRHMYVAAVSKRASWAWPPPWNHSALRAAMSSVEMP